ncbi:MAG: AI-2E family transporter [Acidobacteria bacterium]|nr:AI-2E family transporter [Acidobacteriota bacterium]
MDETLKSVKPWVTFAGAVLVVVVLYWAQAVLVPFALAILFTFVLTPPVTWLQRWIGRVPAVLFVVTLVFIALGLAGWGLTRQMDRLIEDLPGYRANIRTKIADVRDAGKGAPSKNCRRRSRASRRTWEARRSPRAPSHGPLSSPPVRPPGSRALPGWGRSSGRSARRGLSPPWRSSCCSNGGISEIA